MSRTVLIFMEKVIPIELMTEYFCIDLYISFNTLRSMVSIVIQYISLVFILSKTYFRQKKNNLQFLRHRHIMSNTAELINFIHKLQREMTQFNIFPS
jgi:hypothetical protein